MDEPLSTVWSDSGPPKADPEEERRSARQLATACGLEFLEMDDFRIDNDLFRSVPFELMLRYGFLPEHQESDRLSIVMADPSDITKLDELELLIGQPITMACSPAESVPLTSTVSEPRTIGTSRKFSGSSRIPNELGQSSAAQRNSFFSEPDSSQ